VTTITRFAPRRAISDPASPVMPGPNLIDEVSIVKAVSLAGLVMVGGCVR
jgi:hypothetical protein